MYKSKLCDCTFGLLGVTVTLFFFATVTKDT